MTSSLDSLAQGWRAAGGGEVSGPCAGTLAPAHDGDFAGFTGNTRAAFDGAEPMRYKLKSEAIDRSESEGVVEFNL